PKTERRDRKKIVCIAKFAGRVTLKSKKRIVVRHAVAVVNDANHAPAASFGFDTNRLCTGVQRVFQKFFDHRSGPFNNFARGDLVRNSFRKYANSTHYLVAFWASGLMAIPSWSS